MNREETLHEAQKCVCIDRQEAYGTPEDSFTAIAKVWSVILKTEITAAQVCQCMIGLKLVRMTAGSKPDNAVDAAGYAACLNEILDNQYRRDNATPLGGFTPVSSGIKPSVFAGLKPKNLGLAKSV